MTDEQTTSPMPQASGAWHRTHPLSLVIDAYNWGKAIIGFVFSMLVILPRLHMTFRTACMIAAGIILAGVVWLVAEWASRRYRLERDALTLRTGLFTDTRKTIPYDHIHAIDVSAPFFFRPFSLVTLTVDSGGVSDGSTTTLTAVPATLSATLERLRRQACGQALHDSATHGPRTASATDRQPDSAPATGTTDTRGRLVFRASTRDTLLFALTDLGFLAALAVIYGFAQNLRDLLPEGMVDAAEYAVFRYAAGSVLTAFMVAAAVLASMLVVSVVKSLLQYHRFEVWRHGDDLIIVRGLFTRRSVTIPVRRVQTIIIRQSVLRRMLRLSSVQVGLTTPGTEGDGDDDNTRGNVLPVIRDDRLYGTLHDMLPEWNPHEVPIRRTAQGLGRYLLALSVAWTLAAMLALAAAVMTMTSFYASVEGAPLREAAFPDGNPVFEPWFRVIWLLWLLLPTALAGAYAFARRWLRWRTEGYALLPSNRIVVTGSRGLTFVTMVTCRSRIQYVRRRRYAWRGKARGKATAESMVMPLFVMNGYSRLRFAAIRPADARRLHDWATGRPMRP
ncbi:PH domain-containing protein [Bifidobacterium sp. SMB2]|uniref:PH domain-containing protein n=1 Tax=Bifidobacterium saimiriisciurei TaxID=2661627 RepID=A0ABX0C7R7_9BIFI|nr:MULTISPECIES: PH domain-containing protein [Bifidobacterium]NEG95774.1 PH domain-containing protein [Bifidobacterium sp. SMB2]NEH11201.1 PH domain-containing protein [Bifidobacterium saimiriisciurei]